MNPSLVRNIIYPAYRFIQRDGVFSTLKELERNQWLSGNDLKNLQVEKLKQLLDYTYKNVPYYTQLFNELGIKPDSIHSPADFRQVPILTKEIIRNNGNKMITTDPLRKGAVANTGGSTGETLYFYKDVGSRNYNIACDIRLNKWYGINIGDKEAVFWGMPFDVSSTRKIKDNFKRYMQNILHLSTFDMSEKTMLKYADILRGFKPKILRGYPSALFAFAYFLKKNYITDIKPEIIISTGEKSFPFQKELMKDVFGSEIYEKYGSNEFGMISQECAEHHKLHVISDMNYVEFIKDNRPAEKGELGEIVVTSLHNYYMPFLRYKIGDLGVLSDIQCSCGRGFPLMEEVRGRAFDTIITPEGKALGGFFWTFISRAVPGIKQFQIVQNEKNSIDFKIVPESSFSIESTKHLEKEIKEAAGQNFKVNFKVVDEIPLTPSGKFRFIVSKISEERLVMKSKIHKAVVTEINPNHLDCITIDEDLMKKVNLKEFEKVLVVDNTNGARLETYVIKGKKGSGVVSINGASTNLINKGDEIIVMSFTWTDEVIVPQVILVDAENRFIQFLEGAEF